MTNSTRAKPEAGLMAAAAAQIRSLVAAMPIVILVNAILETTKRPAPRVGRQRKSGPVRTI